MDARLAYDMWRRVIAEEDLYEAMLAGKHRELTQRFALGPAELEVLDELHRLPGTRWNIENLRFRSALETSDNLVSYMPRTMHMLTTGNRDWLQELVFEYLARYKWEPLGQYRLAECKRFGEYTKKRILVRRVVPEHFEEVLNFELAVIDLLSKANSIAPADWPATLASPLDDDALGELKPRPSPAASLIEVESDISDWIRSCVPNPATVKEGAITMLAFLPSVQESYKFHKLSEGTRLVFACCDGNKTVAEIADEIEREHEIEAEQVYALLRRWLTDRALAA